MSNPILLEKANKYVEDIINGKEICNEYVKKLCINYKNDLEKQKEEDFEYYLDVKKIKIINNLLKLFVYPTGFYAREPVLDHLEGFQAFLLVNIFGWKYKKDENKSRYRDVVLYISRKCGKNFA